jgi:hypothetical protein
MMAITIFMSLFPVSIRCPLRGGARKPVSLFGERRRDRRQLGRRQGIKVCARLDRLF